MDKIYPRDLQNSFNFLSYNHHHNDNNNNICNSNNNNNNNFYLNPNYTNYHTNHNSNNTICTNTNNNNNNELFDIAQIGQLFDNDDYFDTFPERATSPSIIVNDLKKSMNIQYYSANDDNIFHDRRFKPLNSTESSPGNQTANDSPYTGESSCSSYNVDEKLKNDPNNFVDSNSSKRQMSYSPSSDKRRKKSIENDNKRSDSITNSKTGGLNLTDIEENDIDDYDFEIKEEKIYNETFYPDNITKSNDDSSKQSFNSNSNKLNQKIYKNINFTYWNENDWAQIFTSSYEPINRPVFKVEADKGFFYSSFDDAFICQKKNHFQITTHTTLEKIPLFCKSKTDNTYQQIDKFLLQLYGLKQESPLQKIQIKQSDSDRKPVDYEPIECKFLPEQPTKLTKMRLHFAHTTNNNNRKRNKAGITIPNPDQRYFKLVVEIQIVTKTGKILTLCSSASERVIVRAVNPGQFKQESNDDSIINNVKPISVPINKTIIESKPLEQNVTFFGNVGINTPNPDEALTVVGNVKITGNMLQPSDVRIKENIEPIDTSKALENVSKLKLYKYDYKPEFSEINGGLKSDFGVLAQNVQEIIPEAVIETGDVVLSDGNVINNFLHVNKNRIHMECVGAVIALDDKTKNLDQKIEKLEQFISKNNSQSSDEKLSSSCEEKMEMDNPKSLINDLSQSKIKYNDDNNKNMFCTKRTFKLIIILSIMIIAFGIIGILVIQILQHTKDTYEFMNNTKPFNDYLSKNDTFFYPKVMPPPVVSPLCDSSIRKCKYCCSDSNSKTVYEILNSIDSRPNTTNEFQTVKAVYVSEHGSESNTTSAKVDEKIGLTNPILSVILFSNNPVIYVNLSSSVRCTGPYCEELNGVFYYFVPLSSNIDTKIQFNLAFFLKHGYVLRSCNTQKNGYLCPNTNIDAYTLINSNSSFNPFRNQILTSKQYIYYAPVSYFLHVDFVFRIVSENQKNLDVCMLKSNTINSKMFKEYVFRFYRLC